MPRDLALDVLGRVLGKHQPLDDAFAAHPRLAGLERRDRAFARQLTATTLRRLGQIDDLAAHFLDRPLPARAAVARNVLRLGLAQIAFLGTPAHAAVDTSVRLAASRRAGGHKGLINAVLRRAAAEAPALVDAQDAARLDTPDWLWRSWSAAYGEATARAIAAAHLAEPPLDLTAKEDPGRVAETLGGTVLPTGTVRLAEAARVTKLAGYHDGAWWVQDAAAALPARLLEVRSGEHVLDLCAAPGGKTAQLAATGAAVTAVDRSEKRLGVVAENLARLGLGAELVAVDAGRFSPAEPADKVLLDAPCSATGTIRRHPDVALLKSADEVAKLAAVQTRLLAHAASLVRPGGLVVFATCSLQPEEGPEIAAAFLANHPDFERVPVRPDEVPGLADAVTAAGELRTLPSMWAEFGGLDGFYAVRLKRR